MSKTEAREIAARLIRSAVESAYFRQADGAHSDEQWALICIQLDELTRGLLNRCEKILN